MPKKALTLVRLYNYRKIPSTSSALDVEGILRVLIPYPLVSHSYTMLICLKDLFACLGLTQPHKLLKNFSKNLFYLQLKLLRLG